jgi:hypothetical protein
MGWWGVGRQGGSTLDLLDWDACITAPGALEHATRHYVAGKPVPIPNGNGPVVHSTKEAGGRGGSLAGLSGQMCSTFQQKHKTAPAASEKAEPESASQCLTHRIQRARRSVPINQLSVRPGSRWPVGWLVSGS